MMIFITCHDSHSAQGRTSRERADVTTSFLQASLMKGNSRQVRSKNCLLPNESKRLEFPQCQARERKRSVYGTAPVGTYDPPVTTKHEKGQWNAGARGQSGEDSWMCLSMELQKFEEKSTAAKRYMSGHALVICSSSVAVLCWCGQLTWPWPGFE